MAMLSHVISRQDQHSSQRTTSTLRTPQKSESSFIKKVFKKTVTRFSFKVSSRVLKQAIDSLADSEPNPSGLGGMEVCEDGFELSVHQLSKHDEHLFALLSLTATSLTEFSCRGPLARMIDLREIATFLETKADDADFVKVFNVEGSDCISFKLSS